MSNAEQQGALSPTKLALQKILDLKQQLADAQSDRFEDIAIVSMACRFPRTSNTPEAFWDCLLDGSDEVSEIPDDRWDLDAYFDDDQDAPGKMYARSGCFLSDLDQMDADFFGISPREATWVDPQQRLLLEVSWEALERAGWRADRIADETGLFIGWMHNDYQNESSDSLLNLNPYIATGSAGSFLCGRLSYYLGLEGPSLAVDTACSSSLVALHLAIQSLHRRECERALVGGVNAIVSPTTNVLTCKLKALSVKGHSRAFDASADGYLRGEGCGVIALRRLSDARRDGDPVLAVIRGSAIGHNGFSSGLTAPNPKAQERVIRDALLRAGVAPEEVDYLEAHGTGTELGDPIEMRAAAAVLGQARNGQPLLVGSVKTNIGHLEAAAGMAGLIKVVLAIQKDSIPAQLGFEEPNPHIPWAEIPVKVLVEKTPWPNAERKIAGVSAFGMSGTNAHVVVEGDSGSEPIQTDDNPSSSSPQLLVFSAKTEDAVRQLAARYRDMLRSDRSLNWAQVCSAAANGRRHFEHRAALIAESAEEALPGLDLIERGAGGEGVARGHQRGAPKVVWQFTGQGSQYLGMAKSLYDTQPVFRSTLDECDAQLKQLREGSLLTVLFEDEQSLNNTYWTQPALFAVQKGLVRLLESFGLGPDAVLGHSVGQFAAACAAGVMSWEDGLRLIAERGRLIGALPAGGAMAAVFAGVDDVKEAIRSEPLVSLAAQNGSHIVVSGEEEALTRLMESFSAGGVRCKRLNTSHAFHSALMQPVLGEFQAIGDSVAFRAGEIPLVCNVTGEPLGADRSLDGAYWSRHIREPVQYAKSIAAVEQLGCDVLLEIGPQPILTTMAASAWSGASRPAFVSCMRRDEGDSLSLLEVVSELYVRGCSLDFTAVSGSSRSLAARLPTYPFQRKRFWGPDKPNRHQSEIHTKHHLLGAAQSLAGLRGEKRFENWVAADVPVWMSDHQVMGDVVFPGAAYAEMALAASRNRRLEKLVFERPLRLNQRTGLQTIVRSESGSPTTIEVHSAPQPAQHWSRHFTAVELTDEVESAAAVDRSEIASRCPQTAEPAEFYEMMGQVGLHYGPHFRTITSIQYGERDVLARLELHADTRGYLIPPTILDGAFQSLAIGLLRDDDSSLFLPAGMERLECFASVGGPVWAHAEWREPEGENRVADITIFQDDGEVVVRVEKLKLTPMNRAALRKIAGSGPERLLYRIGWQTSRLAEPDRKKSHWLIVRDGGEEKPDLAAQLDEQGQPCVSVSLASDDASPDFVDGHAMLGVNEASHWDAALAQVEDLEDEARLDGIVLLIEPDTDDGLGRTERVTRGILGLLQALRNRDVRRLDRGLQIVTHHGVAIDDAESVEPFMSGWWGLGRVIGAEQPGLRCRMIDADEVSANPENLVEVLLIDSLENQIGLRDRQLFAPRLETLRPAKSEHSFSADNDGSYLITGGLGMLGRQAAKWLAAKGAGHIVLTSRSEPSDEAKQWLQREVESDGCQVHVHCGDVSRQDHVEAMFERFGNDLPPLRGVIHAAGVLDDSMLPDQNWERFARVLAPKRGGAELLDRMTQETPLDFFIIYSSVASILGSPGQANYSTANAYLDGLVQRRRAAGLPAQSINWGPWTEGMADNETVVKRLALQGITPLTSDESHAALERLLLADVGQATVLDVDWRRMRQRLGSDSPPFLEGVAPAAAPTAGGGSALVDQLRTLAPPARMRLLSGAVQSELQQILSMAEPPDPDTPISEFGLDSLMAVEFSTRLQQQLGSDLAIAPTLLFDYPTVNALSEYLLSLLTELPETETTQRDSTSETKEQEAVAIVGIACRFPGAENIQEYWSNLLTGVDAICEIPPDRWDVDAYYSPTPEPGKMYTREGGFLPNIGDFDAEFFGISGQEACWIDPQHRMLLEVGWEALENAGLAMQRTIDSRVGVFMGIMSQDYAQLHSVDNIDVIDGFQGAGLSHSAGVGRLSYLFGFEGPSIAIDTASSSSLVAVCQAVKSLLDGNCNAALAGGVNAILTPSNSLLLSKTRMLSPEARCKSFSAAADGFARGEGCGVVVLKRLSDAERDGDRVLAVIRGTAVAHNGFSGALTSPSSRSQERVIREAVQEAGLKPAEVQYLEAHGTATPLGDPIEIQAAASVLGKGRSADQPLLVGSVKPNIGHLEAAGGVSGLIKTVLALDHGVIPRQLHFDEPSPHIPWKRLPLQIVKEQTEWPAGETRVAGVSAFGLSGTNAHVVLTADGHVETVEAKSEQGSESVENREQTGDAAAEKSNVSRLLVLSARNPAALRDLAERYESHLHDTNGADLDEFCYTAAVGRRHFERRAAIVANSTTETQAALKELRDRRTAEGLVTGGSRSVPKLAWIFSSLDSPRTRVGAELYHFADRFREVIDQCDERFQQSHDRSLRESMFDATPPESLLLKQTGLFALEMGLAELWKGWGIEPDVVFGHGVGQYAAACFAGVMSLDHGLDLVMARGSLEDDLLGQAASASVFAAVKDVLAELRERSDLRAYAIHADHVIVSGPPEALSSAIEEWNSRGWRCESLARALPGPMASEEQLDVYESVADEADYFPADRPIICPLDAQATPVHRLLAGGYWRRHVAEPLRFADSVRALAELDCDMVMEIGPDLTTCEWAASSWGDQQPATLATLSANRREDAALLDALARLYVHGANPEFSSLPWGASPRKVQIPTYPFQRKRYWITEIKQHLGANGNGNGQRSAGAENASGARDEAAAER